MKESRLKAYQLIQGRDDVPPESPAARWVDVGGIPPIAAWGRVAEALATLEALAAPPALVGVEPAVAFAGLLLSVCADDHSWTETGDLPKAAKLIEADRAAVTRAAELRLLERLEARFLSRDTVSQATACEELEMIRKEVTNA